MSRKKSLARTAKRFCGSCNAKIAPDRLSCGTCGAWNVDEAADPLNDQTILLSDASVADLTQLQTGPWDACFGQQTRGKHTVLGIVNTGVTLLGGAPGAGKSTLALQLAEAIIHATQREILYLEAEESTEELKARATRLNISNLDRVRVIPMGSTSDLATILENRKPSALIVDSLQGLCDTDLDAQVEFCKALKGYTVPGKFPAIVISQVTKDEGFAGLMALQHTVDTTITFDVYTSDDIRELRTVKNRFGPTVTRLLEMTERGLVEYEEEDEDE